MATQYMQGRNLNIFANGIPVGCSKTATIELTTATSDSTTKCDVINGILWANNTPQANSWTLTDNGVVPVLASSGTPTEYSLQQFATWQISQVKVYVEFRGPFNILYGGDAWVTSTKGTASTTDDFTYDVTFTGTGPLRPVAVS